VARAVAVAALPVVDPDDPLALPVRLAVIVPALKLPDASRATIADAVFALVAVVAELLTLSAVAIVSSLVSTMAALALISALTITPEAIEVALPTLVTSPVKLAFVVTFDAVPVRFAVIVPAIKLPDASRATIADAVFALAAVVAELLTFEAVEIVASFVSTIAAEALMSALTMLVARFSLL
jgi:tRNA-binding EMAP/Myf-like protein